MNFELSSDRVAEVTPIDETSLLVIILDTNLGQRILRGNYHILTQCTDSVIAFANAHLTQKAQNKLAIMACQSKLSEFVYPEPGKPLYVRQVDGQYEVFTLLEKTVKQNLIKVLSSETSSVFTESLLAGAIVMALCYIARTLRTKNPRSKINSRILVVTGSGDSTSQYMNYMNAFLTAQKQGVVIDVCPLDPHLSLLQRGCDITNGLYLRILQIQGLLQYTLRVFLPESPIRQKLVLPPSVKVDYKATCFFYRELINIGYVHYRS